MRARALAYSLAGCAAALALTWDIGRGATPPPAVGGAAAPATSPAATPATSPNSSRSASSTKASSPKSSPSHASKPSASHGASGTFTGATANTPYGPMQVAIVVRNGRITDVKALQLTNEGGRSVAISDAAAPELRTEALKAQSAKIDTISGASYTSDGYRTSLQSAIDKAGL